MFVRIEVSKELADSFLSISLKTGKKTLPKKDKKVTEEFIRKINGGKKNFAVDDNEISLDPAGRVSKNAALLYAISETGKACKCQICFNTAKYHPYDDHAALFDKLIHEKINDPLLIDTMYGRSHTPFIMDITPEVASLMLLKNKWNRKISQSHLNDLVAPLNNGTWEGSQGNAITFSTEGYLSDGQNRLQACVITDKVMDDMLLLGRVNISRNFGTEQKRTAKDSIYLASGYPVDFLPVSNVLYQIYTRSHNNSKNIYMQEAMHRELENEVVHSLLNILASKSKYVQVNAPYCAAYVILYLMGYDANLLEEVHNGINRGLAFRGDINDYLYGIKNRLGSHKGEFLPQPSNPVTQQNIVCALIADLKPFLDCDGKGTKFKHPSSSSELEQVKPAILDEVRKVMKPLYERSVRSAAKLEKREAKERKAIIAENKKL